MSDQEEIERLRGLVKEQELGAKMLVRRDLELSKANEKLRELDRLKSEFVSVVAHQLRTPLSAVKWAMQMILEGDVGAVTPEQRSIILKGYESNERMIQLVNDLLNADRIERGDLGYSFVPLQIIDIIDNLLVEFAGKAGKHGVTLTRENPAKPIPPVNADRSKVRVVLQNLIDNAVKYTMRGGSVTIRTDEDGEFVRTSVTDTGIGVPVQQQAQVFSKFFRGANAVRVEQDGSGLGLFIAHEIVIRHGGRVWFDSKENEGTTFYFTLPKAQEAKQAAT